MKSTETAKAILTLAGEGELPDNIDKDKLIKDMAWCLLESIEGLEAYCDCSDGCSCGDGWGHSPSREALEYIQKKIKV